MKSFDQLDKFLKVNEYKNTSYLFSNDYDEPTYVSVRVNFFPGHLQNDNNADLSNFNGFNYNKLSMLAYNDMPHPLFDIDDTSDYSTYNYLLNSLGDVNRANLLKSFIQGFVDLNWNYPFYIKSVNGLSELLKIDPKRGSRVNNSGIITLKCIEGLDMKINYLLNAYRKIAWDDTYQRWILPDMMRFFKMDIIISEFRLFHSFSDNLADDINLKIPTIKYECQMCEFDISDTLNHFNELHIDTIKDPLDDIEIKIKVGNVIEHSRYDLFNSPQDIYDLSLNKLIFKADNSSNNVELPSFDDEKINFSERFGEKYYQPALLFKYDDMNYDYIANTEIKALINEINKVDKNNDNININASENYFVKLIKNTLTNLVNRGVNYAEDKLQAFVQKTPILNGLTLNDYITAVSSSNIISIFNDIKNRADAIKSLYPEVSMATNDINLQLYKDSLKELCTIGAKTEDGNTLVNILNNVLNADYKTTEEINDSLIKNIKQKFEDIEISVATSDNNKKIITHHIL